MAPRNAWKALPTRRVSVGSPPAALSAVSLEGVTEFQGRDVDVVAQFPLSTRLRILPNHACATGPQFGSYNAVSENGDLQEWEPLRGW